MSTGGEPSEELVLAATAGSAGVLAQLVMGSGATGVVAGGLAPVGVQAAYRVAAHVQRRRAAKMGQALEAAGLLDAGLDILDERRPGYDERVELLARVLEAAAHSTLESKIRALGRVLAEGLGDGDTGEALLLAAALGTVEGPHLLMLQFLEAHQESRLVGAKPHRGWDSWELREQLPELAHLLEGLLAVLGAQGLVRSETDSAFFSGPSGPTYWTIADLGRTCLFLLDDPAVQVP